MTNIVFMHVGPDVWVPTIMARSFRKHNPRARIIQMSDAVSPAIEGVDEVFRQQLCDRNLMLFRMRCFAALAIDAPSWFLDTDMLCNRMLEFEAETPAAAAVCLREFDCDKIFNHTYADMDMSEYKGRTMGSIYPYVACTTRLERPGFWTDCLAAIEALDPKFHFWYGDQEAIRNVIDAGRYPVGTLPESLYACPPEYENPSVQPYISHYKGHRKLQMLQRAARESLI